jgi:hypothetical protein
MTPPLLAIAGITGNRQSQCSSANPCMARDTAKSMGVWTILGWGTIGGWWGTVDLGEITEGCNRWVTIGGW